MSNIIEWLAALVIAIFGIYVTILENRRVEKLRTQRQKVEELAKLADKICLIKDKLTGGEKYPYSEINLDIVAHMRIISDFYLDKKLFNEINILQSNATALLAHENDARDSGEIREIAFWSSDKWCEELASKRRVMIDSIPLFKQACLELKSEIEPVGFYTKIRTKIKSVFSYK